MLAAARAPAACGVEGVVGIAAGFVEGVAVVVEGVAVVGIEAPVGLDSKEMDQVLLECLAVNFSVAAAVAVEDIKGRSEKGRHQTRTAVAQLRDLHWKVSEGQSLVVVQRGLQVSRPLQTSTRRQLEFQRVTEGRLSLVLSPIPKERPVDDSSPHAHSFPSK